MASVSVAEQILARAQQALADAGIAGGVIDRGNDSAYDETELPAVNLKRGATDSSTHAQGLIHHRLEFEVEHYTDADDWETACDALHMLTHAVLATDDQLAALGRGLTCTGTEALGASADITSGKLIARYQIQFLTRPGDLTRAVN